jgi:two-component system response regulator QseB
MKLLIVDDDLLLCSALARGLIRLGHASRTTSSVDSALALIASEEPAALLTDLDLGPGGDGIDLLRRLRAAGSALPALLMTGSDLGLTRARLAAAGLAEIRILPKPFELAELLEELGRLLPLPHALRSRDKPPTTTMAALVDNVVRAFGGRVM